MRKMKQEADLEKKATSLPAVVNQKKVQDVFTGKTSLRASQKKKSFNFHLNSPMKG